MPRGIASEFDHHSIILGLARKPPAYALQTALGGFDQTLCAPTPPHTPAPQRESMCENSFHLGSMYLILVRGNIEFHHSICVGYPSRCPSANLVSMMSQTSVARQNGSFAIFQRDAVATFQ